MRKITFIQITVFGVLLAIILVLAVLTSCLTLAPLPSSDFRGIIITVGTALLTVIFALGVYRLFLWAMPLRTGELPQGSCGEFAAQIHLLFYLVCFNSLITTHLLPIPLRRWIYLALGARLGRDTYSAGALLDPALTTIGDNSIVGHDAVVFAHIIEGSRFELSTVTIGNGVTIGAHAVIMPDVKIGDGAIVCAGAVVTKGSRIDDGEVWGGVPARRLGQRAEQTTGASGEAMPLLQGE